MSRRKQCLLCDLGQGESPNSRPWHFLAAPSLPSPSSRIWETELGFRPGRKCVKSQTFFILHMLSRASRKGLKDAAVSVLKMLVLFHTQSPSTWS